MKKLFTVLLLLIAIVPISLALTNEQIDGINIRPPVYTLPTSPGTDSVEFRIENNGLIDIDLEDYDLIYTGNGYNHLVNNVQYTIVDLDSYNTEIDDNSDLRVVVYGRPSAPLFDENRCGDWQRWVQVGLIEKGSNDPDDIIFLERRVLECIENGEQKHFLVVDDQSPASDVQLLLDVALDLGWQSQVEYVSKVNSEVTRADLEDRVTLFIYNGKAAIVIGDSSPAQHVEIGIDISTKLRLLGIDNSLQTSLVSSEVYSDDLRTIFGFTDSIKTPNLQVSDIDLSNGGEVEAGRTLLATVEVRNNGNRDVEDVKVEISIPELGLSNVEYMDEIDEDEEEESDTLTIRIPSYVESGRYKLIATITGDDAIGDEEIVFVTVKNLYHDTSISCIVRDTLIEGERSVYTVNGLELDVELYYMDEDEAVFVINGERTNKLSVSESYKLRNGFELLVKEVVYQDYSGGLRSTLFCLDTNDEEERRVPHLQITDIDLGAQSIDAGRMLPVAVQVLNKGDQNVYDVRIEVLIPELGLSDTEFISEIDEDEEEASELFLRIPSYVENGKYEVVAKVTADDTTGDKESVFVTINNPDERVSIKPIVVEPVASEQESRNVCDSCLSDGTCVPFGTRFVEDGIAQYCSIDKDFHPQKDVGMMCQNNYECTSNQCSSGQCVDLINELRETRGLLEAFVDWFNALFA